MTRTIFFLQVYFQFLYFYRHVVVRVMAERQIIFLLILEAQKIRRLLLMAQQIPQPILMIRINLVLMGSSRQKCPSMKNLRT